MKRKISFVKDCHGSMTVAVVILMFVIAGLLAVVFDMAHVEVAKNELQNAGDACALRGARAFLPDNINLTGYTPIDPDPDNAKLQAQNTIANNKSDNTAFQTGDLPISDIEVGLWDFSNRTFLPWQWPPPSSRGQYVGPAVSLPTKRTDTASLGPVSTKLAAVFGTQTVSVVARATAALTPPAELPRGYKDSFPIFFNEDKLSVTGDETICVTLDMADLGGWTSLDNYGEANAKSLIDLIKHLKQNPQVKLDDRINRVLTSYVDSSVIDAIVDYYKTRPGLTEVETGVYRPISPIYVVVPVVKISKFGQTYRGVDLFLNMLARALPLGPGQAVACTSPTAGPVKGFTGVNIEEIRNSKANDEKNRLKCKRKKGVTGGTSGGGRYYGLLSTVPKLVE